jgi:hypothetical protein
MPDRQNPRSVFQGEPGELVALEANLKDQTIEATCSSLSGELLWVFRAKHEDRAVERFAHLLPQAASSTWKAYLEELREHAADVDFLEEQTRLSELQKLDELRRSRKVRREEQAKKK